jgi:hypothetical protein
MSNRVQREFSEQHYRVRYALVTFVIALPLIFSFVSLRNVYPSTAWTVMMSGGSLERDWTYYIVRGETVTGEIVDINPTRLTNSLYGRTWSLVRAAVNNDAFRLDTPHPQNVQLLESVGGPSNLPEAARVGELLDAWGYLYNSKLPSSSPSRLKAVRIDVYRWDSKRFADFDRFVETWREEL